MVGDPDNKLGGTCSILLGGCYLLIGADYFLVPAAQRIGGVDYLASFAATPLPSQLQWLLFALAGMVGVAAVQGISRIVPAAHSAWVRWTSVLAISGFLVAAVGNLQLMSYWTDWAAAYRATTDAAAQANMAAQTGILSLDPYGWFGFGAIGLWILVVSVLTLNDGPLPKSLAYVGLATAVAYGLVVVGISLQIEILVAVAAGLGGIILAPIWYIGVGLWLRAPASAKRAMSPAV